MKVIKIDRNGKQTELEVVRVCADGGFVVKFPGDRAITKRIYLNDEYRLCTNNDPLETMRMKKRAAAEQRLREIDLIAKGRMLYPWEKVELARIKEILNG